MANRQEDRLDDSQIDAYLAIMEVAGQLQFRLEHHLRSAADEFVTDFGTEYSMLYSGPRPSDGLEGELLVTIPAPLTDSKTPRGTTALRHASPLSRSPTRPRLR